MRTRSFLLSRPGIRDGCEIPLRLQLFDTIGTLIEVLRLPMSLFGAMAVGACGAQAMAGIGLPKRIAFAVAFPLMFVVVLLLWNPRHSLLVSLYRDAAVLARLATRSEARHFPLADDRWPDEWQQQDPAKESVTCSRDAPVNRHT